MNRSIHLLGAPTSAAAHWPGQEKAPAALRAAGLVEHLQKHPLPITDRGDLPTRRWTTARQPHGAFQVNNLDVVIEVANEIGEEIRDALVSGGFPVVIGGDCTITVGAFAGALHAGRDPALVYVDGGWDLSNPSIYPKGILDSMGAAHLLGAEGTTRLREIGPRMPMLSPDRYIQFGHAPEDPPGRELEVVEALNLNGVPAEVIRGRGAGSATETLASYLDADQPYWLHFDVDVIDFFDLPVADVPIYDDAIPAADAFAAVQVFATDPRCIGMTVTEFNPDHGHPDGREARVLASALADILLPVA